ncbi:hypothetical protein CC2G_002598 [Coprinopsis cinerea AmutBmut pab1-1]|nr:hypothetical protein CC2G_002598 [Coprinopsis cinerea AmutBmut pab1-1]
MALYWLKELLVFHLLAWSTDPYPPTASSCVSWAHDLAQLAHCLNRFTVLHGSYDTLTYNQAQPTPLERRDWNALVQSVVAAEGDCRGVEIPASLRAFYGIETFYDDGTRYCLLAEHSTMSQHATRGWGSLIVRPTSSRTIHLSAPHPVYDTGSVEQAAGLFKLSGAKSLLLSGRARSAFLQPSNCTSPSTGGRYYYQTDPTHSKDEPFVEASIAIHSWQTSHGGCPNDSCAFIQIHAKSQWTCVEDQIFLSSGIGRSNASIDWYTDSTDRPIKRLQHELRKSFPSWNISLPHESNCALIASKNVFGRYINGVDRSDLCSIPSKVKDVTGEFVHVEQALEARADENIEAWARALRAAFPPPSSRFGESEASRSWLGVVRTLWELL